MNDSALQSTMRELQRVLRAPPFWAAIGGAALLLGLTGPFGTYEGLALPARLAYWAAMSVATYVVGFGTVLLLNRLHNGALHPGPLAYGLYGAIAGVPVTAVVLALNARRPSTSARWASRWCRSQPP